MKYLLVSLALTFLFVGCSSGRHPHEKMQAPKSGKMVQYNFLVRDRSHEEPPLWSYDFHAYSDQADTQGQDRFFVGESGDVNERIVGCDLAKAKAKEAISSEIAEMLTSKMALTKDGETAIKKMESRGGGLKSSFAQVLRTETQQVLSGVRVVSSTWEERDYSQAGGVSSVFNCMVLVKMNKKNLEDSIKLVMSKVLERNAPESKSSLLKVLDAPIKEFAYGNSSENN